VPGSELQDTKVSTKHQSKTTATTQKEASYHQSFILITVDNRLGVKATVPCLPSNTIEDFKKLIGAQIGRRHHTLTLKRQGERPMKEFLTLEDYPIGNILQLDLEIGFGDN
jgi:hypothetical protein